MFQFMNIRAIYDFIEFWVMTLAFGAFKGVGLVRWNKTRKQLCQCCQQLLSFAYISYPHKCLQICSCTRAMHHLCPAFFVQFAIGSPSILPMHSYLCVVFQWNFWCFFEQYATKLHPEHRFTFILGKLMFAKQFGYEHLSTLPSFSVCICHSSNRFVLIFLEIWLHRWRTLLRRRWYWIDDQEWFVIFIFALVVMFEKRTKV